MNVKTTTAAVLRHVLLSVRTNVRTISLGFLLFSLSACMQSQSLVAGDKMSNDSTVVEQPIFDQSMGGERDAVVASADAQWQSDAECVLEKTGVGVDRRAYFLERCTYQNSQQVLVCGMAPESVEYAFLEGSLVQVMYKFSEADQASYGACLQEQALASGFTAADPAASDSEATNGIRLIAADAKTGVTIGEERDVRVYSAEVVPTVHMLRGNI